MHCTVLYIATMASILSAQLSDSEKRYLVDGIADDCRIDGRSREEIRPHAIVTNSKATTESGDGHPPLVLSNGSARLMLSASGSAATHILCSVKVELGRPSESNSNQGCVMIHVEDSQASTSQSRRKADEERNYLQSIISELLGENLLDLESLCVIPNYYAFTVNVDVEILSGTAGNLVDACCHTILAALQNTLLPNITPSSTAGSANTASIKEQATSDLILESDIRQAIIPAGIERAPIVVTVTVCQRSESNSFLLVLDASLEEEACSYCQVHVAVDPPGDSEPTICSLRKTGSGALPWVLLPDITALAFQGVPKAMESYRIAKPLQILSQQQSMLQEQVSIQ